MPEALPGYGVLLGMIHTPTITSATCRSRSSTAKRLSKGHMASRHLAWSRRVGIQTHPVVLPAPILPYGAKEK